MKTLGTNSSRNLVVLALCSLLTASCGSTGYTAFLKRSPGSSRATLLASVHTSREELSAGQAQFGVAHERLFQLVECEFAETDDPEALRQGLLEEVDRCAEEAGALRERIVSLESDHTKLSTVTSVELEEYSSPEMRAHGEALAADTKAKFDQMLASYEHIQQQMEVVLLAHRDFAIFFNHNLNERALSSLSAQGERFVEEMTTLDNAIEVGRGHAESLIAALEGHNRSSENGLQAN